MKRILTLLLALLLLTPMAHAATNDELEKDDWYVRSLVPVGETVYILASRGVGASLFGYHPGENQMKLISAEMAYAPYKSTETNQLLAFSELFSDGETLYGFDHLTSTVFRLEITETGVQAADTVKLATIDPMLNVSGNAATYQRAETVLAVNGRMLWLGNVRINAGYTRGLLNYDLTTGRVRQCVPPESISLMCAWENDKVLLLCGTGSLYAYDPVTDEITHVATLDSGAMAGNSCMAWSKELQRLVVQEATRLMSVALTGEISQVGFVPVYYPAQFVLAGNNLVMRDYDQLVTTALRQDFAAEHSLTIMDGDNWDLIADFSVHAGDLPYYLVNSRDNWPASTWFTMKDAPDMAIIDTPDEMARLVEAGLLLNLADYPELTECLDALYPVFRQTVSNETGVYGLPTYAISGDGWNIDRTVMNAMGLTEADLPTNLVDLCAFITRWNDEFAEKYPQYMPLNGGENLRQRMTEIILQRYIEYAQKDGALSFDTPLFRELLAAVDAMRTDKIEAAQSRSNPEQSDYATPLFWSGAALVGNHVGNTEDSAMVLTGLSLTAETPLMTLVHKMDAWVIRADSPNAEYAVSLLAEIIRQAETDGYKAVMLRQDASPVENPDWERTVAAIREDIARLEAARPESVYPAAVDNEIAYWRQYLESETGRYAVSPEYIAWYVEEVVPAIRIVRAGEIFTVNSTGNGALNRYIAGEINAEDLIAALVEVTP